MSHLFASPVASRGLFAEGLAIRMRDGMAAAYQAGCLAGVSKTGEQVGIC
jgi:hypothetical protein